MQPGMCNHTVLFEQAWRKFCPVKGLQVTAMQTCRHALLTCMNYGADPDTLASRCMV